MTTPAGPERWRLLSALFDRALDLDPAAREALLCSECAGDPALRQDLERMLAADADNNVFDEGAAAWIARDAAPEPERHADDRQAIGSRLGAWRLDRLLGRGGMGTVYAAHRDDGDTLQRAAIKRLQRRWDGSLQAQRFLQERRILAALAHPNIPRLLDHGLDDEGRPWFALDYVDGQPVVAWADDRRLDLSGRLDLFRQVCEAVQHAHEHFVVHRDLKPDNILVDVEGQARVLDFGVAKRMDEHAGTTRTGLMAGFTPEYAAPEQMSGGTISAATDVFALGVVLYQLMAGRLPFVFAAADLRAASEAISLQQAPRLEQAVTTGTAEEVGERLARRRTDARAFRRFVRGDLSRILQTALAKEPQRRYASVRAFSDDLKRFLEGRPVSVSGDTLGYRARMFVRRNRLGVAMAAVAGIAMVAGTGFSLYRAQQERIQRERGEVVLQFMSELFRGEAADGGYGNQLTAVQLLDRAAGRIDGVFVGDPRGKAALLRVVSGAYVSIGMHEQAVAYGRQAVDMAAAFRGEAPEEYLLMVYGLAEALSDNSRYPDVVALLDPELPLARRHARRQPWEGLLLLKRGYAHLELGALELAEADLRRAIAGFEAFGEREDGIALGYTASAYNDLAFVVSDQGHHRQALDYLLRAEAINLRDPRSSELDLSVGKVNRAREHFRLGEVDRAIALLEGAIPDLDTLIGARFSRTVTARNLLGQAYASQGRNAEALAIVERNLHIQRDAGEDDPVMLAVTQATRAKLLTYSGRAGEAVSLARESLDFLRAEYPDPTPLRGRASWILGEALLQAQRCGEAEPFLRDALSDERAATGDAPTVNAGEAYDSLGRCRLQQGDAAGAEDLLARAVGHFTGSLGTGHQRTLRSDIHRLWATHARSSDPAHLAAIRERRDQLTAAMGTEDTPVIWQLDLLLDDLSQHRPPFGLDLAVRTRLLQKLAEEADSSAAPFFFGLNSFS